MLFFFFSSRRRHTRYWRDWSSDVCSSDLRARVGGVSPPDDAQAEERGDDGEPQLGSAGEEVLDGGQDAVAGAALPRRRAGVRQAVPTQARLARYQAAGRSGDR